jgi:hypothetical protein
METSKTEILYKQISELDNSEKALLLSKLIADISASMDKDKKLNFYNIKGFGKEIWKGIDAQEYVNKEREAWK